jgi:hypothetical protein
VGKEDSQIVGRFGEEEINNGEIFFKHRDVHKYE